MTTNTERKIYTELWTLDMMVAMSEANPYTTSTPTFIEGENPLQDTEDCINSPNQIFYFYYPMKKYPGSYWKAYLQSIKSAPQPVRFCVASAESLNKTLGIMGPFTPKVWVLAVEVTKNPH